MALTTFLALPYPAAADAPDAPGAIYALAQQLDTILGAYKTVSGVTQRWNGSIWQNWESPWTTYSPGFQNTNFNFTTAQWRYRAGRVLVRIGGTVTTSTGNGQPVIIAAPVNQVGVFANGRAVINNGTRYPLVPDFYTTGLFQFRLAGTATESVLTSSSPATWANGNTFDALIEYDAT